MTSLFQTLKPSALRHRLFAFMEANSGSSYEQLTEARKRALFGGLHGDVLEIGPGGGPNLHYYAADVHWVGVEPNPYMHPYLVRSIRTLGRSTQDFRIDPGDSKGIRLPAGDESVDAVVSTLVLCSVPHPDDSLREILRVLKPGGRFVFMEHVAAPQGSRLRFWQDFIQPVWTLTADGCHPNRETWETIAQAGFAQVEIEHFQVPDVWLAGPHVAGVGVKG